MHQSTIHTSEVLIVVSVIKECWSGREDTVLVLNKHK